MREIIILSRRRMRCIREVIIDVPVESLDTKIKDGFWIHTIKLAEMEKRSWKNQDTRDFKKQISRDLKDQCRTMCLVERVKRQNQDVWFRIRIDPQNDFLSDFTGDRIKW